MDSKGNVLDGDHILFLGVENLWNKILTNNLIITTQMSFGFEKAWNKIGGILYRTDVGDKFVYKAIGKKTRF